MTDIIKASSSKGYLTLTDKVLRIRVPGSSERSIARTSISEVSIGLGFWYGFGFLRVLRITVMGEKRPIVLSNMRKSKAKAIKTELGF